MVPVYYNHFTSLKHHKRSVSDSHDVVPVSTGKHLRTGKRDASSTTRKIEMLLSERVEQQTYMILTYLVGCNGRITNLGNVKEQVVCSVIR